MRLPSYCQWRTLELLSDYQVAPERLQFKLDYDITCGGYGEVRVAQMDGRPLVAVKTLRPAGSGKERARVATVRPDTRCQLRGT